MTNKPPAVDDELRAAAARNAELIGESHVFLCLFNEHLIDEVIPLLQMGLAVFLDKPIALLVPKGVTVPMNLRRLALQIAEFDANDLTSMNAALAELKRTLAQ